MQPVITRADDRTAGLICTACDSGILGGESMATCPACGAAHHHACWERTSVCSSYACAPANRGEPIERERAGGLVITPDQLVAAEPLPALPSSRAGVTFNDPKNRARPKLSGNAIAAAICAVGGIPFFGLITGAVAVILASISFGPIRSGVRRGAWLAGGALLLGLVDVVGWAFVLSHYAGGSAHIVGFNTADFHVSEEDLRSAPPIVAAALRANVLICRTGLLDGALGSGVVISIRDGSAVILTNRHVASPDRDSPGGTVSVQFVDGRFVSGTVDWVAPGGIDAALVRVPTGPGVVAAKFESTIEPHIGDDVFAVGNPQGLGWTHTKGSISQFRERRRDDGKPLRVIQTSAPINPGNSGGGLYTESGDLIGINTWVVENRDTDGLGFAISIASLRTMLPDWALGGDRQTSDAKPSDGDKSP